MAIPLLKWAGNKRWIAGWLNTEIANIELETGTDWRVSDYSHYFEPFCGTASMYLRLSSEGIIQPNAIVHLNDLNPVVMNLHSRIASENYSEVCREVAKLAAAYRRENKDGVIPKNQSRSVRESRMYYKKRKRLNSLIKRIDSLSEKQAVELAALTVFINKTCYNGLWRVNPRGEFNVPEGRYPDPGNISNQDSFHSCHNLLHRAKLSSVDWKEAVNKVPPNSLVYLDPPYFPLEMGSSVFSDYEKGGFSNNEHEELIEYSIDLVAKGSRVILSNHDSKEFVSKINRTCKERNLNIKEYRIPTMRKISQNISNRRSVNELLLFIWQ